ncbi:MAG: hypothetical protein GQF41_0690 [Candidatus Rifleibacterium amylolyticum]|nr:MAG: hypothetical protein GQF41_0690 [Candidatus Rifleibacterium amylolyticum]
MTPLDKHRITDEQIVARIIRGERKMLDVLFERYIERLLRYVVLFVKSNEEARDITQDILVKIFQALGSFKSTGRFESWFFTIARRTLIDCYRKKKIKTFSFDSQEVDEPAIPAQDGIGNAPELLKSLPARDREILQLRFLESLSYGEIAEITGMSEGSLRNVVCRSIRRIQEDNPDELS